MVRALLANYLDLEDGISTKSQGTPKKIVGHSYPIAMMNVFIFVYYCKIDSPMAKELATPQVYLSTDQGA